MVGYPQRRGPAASSIVSADTHKPVTSTRAAAAPPKQPPLLPPLAPGATHPQRPPYPLRMENVTSDAAPPPPLPSPPPPPRPSYRLATEESAPVYPTASPSLSPPSAPPRPPPIVRRRGSTSTARCSTHRSVFFLDWRARSWETPPTEVEETRQCVGRQQESVIAAMGNREGACDPLERRAALGKEQTQRISKECQSRDRRKHIQRRSQCSQLFAAASIREHCEHPPKKATSETPHGCSQCLHCSHVLVACKHH